MHNLAHIPPDFKELLIVALAAPGFWELLKQLFKWIHDALPWTTKKTTLDDVNEELKSHKKDLDSLGSKMDILQENQTKDHDAMEENRADVARTRIIMFNDELLHNTPHSEEAFKVILTYVDDYEEYCGEHPKYRNSIAVASIANIRRVYAKLMEEGGFL